MSKNNVTPAMQQYLTIKQEYPDAFLFYRMGDFYEMFYKDAVEGSKILEIALTTRDKQKENPIPMCGIPYHALENYLSKMIKGGHKAAICEQIGNPKESKGIVKREVVRVVTPGTALSPNLLTDKEDNYLCAITEEKKRYGLAVAELSTGNFIIGEFESWEDLVNEIARISPREIIVREGKTEALSSQLNQLQNILYTGYDKWKFELETAYHTMTEQLGTTSLDGFGCEDMPLAIPAGGALISYLLDTQKKSIGHINKISLIKQEGYLKLDQTTIRNLELVTRADGSSQHTLLSIVDATLTAMGGRLIRNWLLHPLYDLQQIRKRHEAVEELKEDISGHEKLKELLGGMRDIERLLGRLTLSAAGPRDLRSLGNSLQILPQLKEHLAQKHSSKLKKINDSWDNLADIATYIDSNISDTPPFTIRDRGIIKDGVNSELDSLREILDEGKKWIANMELRERAELGVPTLKIKFNNVFGYFVEVSKKDSDKIPDTYTRKQTLVNAERYISPELKEYEEKALSAEEKIMAIEQELFEEIRWNVISEGERIKAMGHLIAKLDILVSFAEIANRFNYAKPTINDGNSINIKEGWHPILNTLSSTERFVPNDTFLDTKNEQIMIITGPNMAGKSTYIRQVALIVLIAQIGSFIPAASAEIGIVDRIFTRVGAQDLLYKGQSTFMVEMNETANILNNATEKSLIILDEIGRGTSTFDGISIAWAVVEHLHDKIGAKTLFATHYHELTELRLSMDRVLNYSIAVREWNDELIFLRKIIKGEVDKSYGIQVARLAGLPKEIIERAREILSNLENKEFDETGSPKIAEKKGSIPNRREPVLPLFTEDSRVTNKIKKLDIENITPLEALTKLAELKRLVEDKGDKT